MTPLMVITRIYELYTSSDKKYNNKDDNANNRHTGYNIMRYNENNNFSNHHGHNNTDTSAANTNCDQYMHKHNKYIKHWG